MSIQPTVANAQPPLIVITGPTASGKSSLALSLAERYNGEIICADSRTVYRGTDIGTAKPTNDEQARVPHHLLDVIGPDERFTAGDFQRLAEDAIKNIRLRGRVPFLVGGTGLYIDSVVLNFTFNNDPIIESERKQLMLKPDYELVELLKKHHIELPANLKNKRHLVRAWEQRGVNKKRLERPVENTFVVSIATDKLALEKKITARMHHMFVSGVVSEARRLGERYGWEHESMTGNIYPILHDVLDEKLSEAEAIKLCIIRDRQLAKRQVTWIKQHDYVKWCSIDEANAYVIALLQPQI